MTNEEAIYRLKNTAWLGTNKDREETEQAVELAIEALSAEAVPPSLADVYKWERDIALSQLEEYGIGFAEKKRDDLVEAVRCKDCKHQKFYYKDAESFFCKETGMVNMHIDDGDGEFWCKYGERKNNEQQKEGK